MRARRNYPFCFLFVCSLCCTNRLQLCEAPTPDKRWNGFAERRRGPCLGLGFAWREGNYEIPWADR